MNYVHEGVKNYKCDKCDKEFNYALSLNNHKKIVHEGLKQYTCKKCNKKFASPNAVKHHLQNQCEMGFSDAENLSKHKKEWIEFMSKQLYYF